VRLPASRLHRALLAGVGLVALLTLAGLIALWPDGRTIPGAGADVTGSATARVTGVDEACRSVPPDAPGLPPGGCRRVTIEVTSGARAGETGAFDLVGVGVDVGDRIRVTRTELPPGATVGGVAADAYAFADFERRSPLLILTLVFVALVLAFGRWRGLRALAGLAAALAVVVLFVVPAILEGHPPILVAVVGSLAIMLATVLLGHGAGAKALAALLGTAVALGLTLLLAELAVDVAHISGLASEDVTFLQATASELSVRGLLLAGIVIGALGVLDDLTVSQASTVLALRGANPALGAAQLFRRGMAVGHDHIVATVNTLVLAYAGASLPVLLIFSLADTGFLDAVNSEVVATQIVATLVGSIGLIAAVPITTGLAALLAVRMEPGVAGHGAHAHPH